MPLVCILTVRGIESIEERCRNANIHVNIVRSQLRDSFVVEAINLSVSASEDSPKGKMSSILINELSPIVLLSAVSRQINKISAQRDPISIQIEPNVKVVAFYKNIVIDSLLRLHLLVHIVVFSRKGKGSLNELERCTSSNGNLFSQLFGVLIHRGELCAGFVEAAIIESEWLAVVRDEETAV